MDATVAMDHRRVDGDRLKGTSTRRTSGGDR
jgi:hypothetical protein